MNNEEDHLQQAFTPFQVPGVACYYRTCRLAGKDTALLPKTACRYPDRDRCYRRNHTWWDHRLPHHRLSPAYPVLEKGGLP